MGLIGLNPLRNLGVSHAETSLSLLSFLFNCLSSFASPQKIPVASYMMSRQNQLFTLLKRRFHSPSSDAPSETLRKKIAGLQKVKKQRNPKKNQFLVEVPESRSYLDTATMPMFLAVVGIALFAKVLMMIDDSKSQEMIERKIANAPVGQGTVRMLEREEWDEFREVRPRTPFESKLARPNAQIRTGEPVRKDDLKNWTIDVLTDALARTEEIVRRGST